MSGMGTDVLALACILGGAAVSGGATVAALEARGARGHDCAMESVASRTVVIRTGDHDARVVVTPAIEIRGGHGCVVMVGRDVRVDVDEVRARARSKR